MNVYLIINVPFVDLLNSLVLVTELSWNLETYHNMYAMLHSSWIKVTSELSMLLNPFIIMNNWANVIAENLATACNFKHLHLPQNLPVMNVNFEFIHVHNGWQMWQLYHYSMFYYFSSSVFWDITSLKVTISLEPVLQETSDWWCFWVICKSEILLQPLDQQFETLPLHHFTSFAWCNDNFKTGKNIIEV